MNYAAKIARFEQRAAEIEGKLNNLSERRKAFALGAVEGNKTSLKAIQDIDCEADDLRHERETLTAAIEQARQLQHDQEAEISRKDRESRLGEARKIADSVLTLNMEIDSAMKTMRQMFERRANLVRQLGGIGVIDPSLILRMLQRLGPTCAARKAELNRYISIEHVPPHQLRPLAESAAGLVRILSRADVSDETQDQPQDAA